MNKGDKVKVLKGPHTDQVGIIIHVLPYEENTWYYVRLQDGLVEFRCAEEALAKMQGA